MVSRVGPNPKTSWKMISAVWSRKLICVFVYLIVLCWIDASPIHTTNSKITVILSQISLRNFGKKLVGLLSQASQIQFDLPAPTISVEPTVESR